MQSPTVVGMVHVLLGMMARLFGDLVIGNGRACMRLGHKRIRNKSHKNKDGEQSPLHEFETIYLRRVCPVRFRPKSHLGSKCRAYRLLSLLRLFGTYSWAILPGSPTIQTWSPTSSVSVASGFNIRCPERSSPTTRPSLASRIPDSRMDFPTHRW